MKKFSLLLTTLLFFATALKAQNQASNWTNDQLIQPATLASDINSGKNLPTILCVGPGAVIPHSIHTGEAGKSTGIGNLKTELKNHKKDDNIVIYCGCCPFAQCPNVRPAIEELKKEGFTNYHLLNLPQNINANWIAKGYPINKN